MGIVIPLVAILAIVGALLLSRRRMAKSRLSYVAEQPPAPRMPEAQPAPHREVDNEQLGSKLPAGKFAELATREIHELPASKEGVLYG